MTKPLPIFAPGCISMPVLSLVLSAYFSATETAFSTMSHARMKTMADKGDKSAALALQLADNYDTLLSAILIGNNLVNILLSSVATLLCVKFLGEQTGASVATASVTVVVLIFGEISPKSIAKESPEKFAMFSAPFIRALMVLLKPGCSLNGKSCLSNCSTSLRMTVGSRTRS